MQVCQNKDSLGTCASQNELLGNILSQINLALLLRKAQTTESQQFCLVV